MRDQLLCIYYIHRHSLILWTHHSSSMLTKAITTYLSHVPSEMNSYNIVIILTELVCPALYASEHSGGLSCNTVLLTTLVQAAGSSSLSGLTRQ